MRRFLHRRGAIVASAALALVIAVAGGAYAAGGSSGGTITACVHKRGGGLYEARKCARHDAKLSWSQQGPIGPQGATGATGATGAAGAAGAAGQNGAVAGFSTTHYSFQDITSATSSSPATILTKSLPAGSFIVTAKTTLSATGTASSNYVNDQCNLSDGAAVDTAQWSSPFHFLILSTYGANGTVSMNLALTTTSASTVTLSCYPVALTGTATGAAYSALVAVQTSSNS